MIRIADILAEPIDLVKCLYNVQTERVYSGHGCGVKITFDGHGHGGIKIRRSGIALLDSLSLGQVNYVGDIGNGPIRNEPLEGSVVGNQEILYCWWNALASRLSPISSLSRVSSLFNQMVIGGEIAGLELLFLDFDTPNLLWRIFVLKSSLLATF